MCSAARLCFSVYMYPFYTNTSVYLLVPVHPQYKNTHVCLNVHTGFFIFWRLLRLSAMWCCGLSVITWREYMLPHHLCLGNCACLPDTCLYVLYVLWIAIRVVHTGYSLPAHAMPDGHPSFSLMSWGLLKSLALATNQQPHCTVYISSCLHASNSHVAI